MAEFFSFIWMIVSFCIGVLWSIVWFVLSDLLSTVAWIGIFIWLGFALRYRSFTHGSLALGRYGRYALAWLWRWIRKKPVDSPLPMPMPETKIVREYRHRVPVGHASLSEQMNVLLILLIIVMANA
ncbi:MAG: hypothetical protein KTR19_08780 [Hyphomicrobiales bacterium]|nr:hypothetical protein [Hyphomicrobiales bacterium]